MVSTVVVLRERLCRRFEHSQAHRRSCYRPCVAAATIGIRSTRRLLGKPFLMLDSLTSAESGFRDSDRPKPGCACDLLTRWNVAPRVASSRVGERRVGSPAPGEPDTQRSLDASPPPPGPHPLRLPAIVDTEPHEREQMPLTTWRGNRPENVRAYLELHRLLNGIQQDHPEVSAPLRLALLRARRDGDLGSLDEGHFRAVVAEVRLARPASAETDPRPTERQPRIGQE